MTKREAQAKKEALIAEARRLPLDSAEHRAINEQISNINVTFFNAGMPRTNRAGQRQAAERRAMYGWRR